MLPPACRFYLLQGATLSALWLAVWLGSGVDFFRLAEKLSNTALRPSWIPRRIFLFLVSEVVYRPAAYSTIPLLFLGAWMEYGQRPGCWLVRLVLALAVTLFQLGDSCRTSSHRDYLMMYICWALVVVSDEDAQAVAYGLCVLYILGSGISKVRVGGLAWAKPETMRSILATFAKKTPKQGGPVLAFANRLVRSNAYFCGFCGCLTLTFECAAPVAFVLPQPWRLCILGGGMVLLHLAIGALQSGAIGAFFLPNVAAYVFGFGEDSDLSVFSHGWCLAVITCFGPLCLGSLRATSLLEENWPCTPFALFPWSSSQWDFLHETFVEGSTRLVAPSSLCAAGQRVIAIEHRSDVPLMERRVAPEDEEAVCYDLWSRSLGITTYQDEIMLALLQTPGTQPLLAESHLAQRILQATQTFLETERVVELTSGRPLMSCSLVVVDSESRVQRIL